MFYIIVKSVTFLNEGFVCARCTYYFEMTKVAEPRQSLGFLIELKFCKSEFLLTEQAQKM